MKTIDILVWAIMRPDGTLVDGIRTRKSDYPAAYGAWESPILYQKRKDVVLFDSEKAVKVRVRITAAKSTKRRTSREPESGRRDDNKKHCD